MKMFLLKRYWIPVKKMNFYFLLVKDQRCNSEASPGLQEQLG